jgi:hypothetical protein
MKELQSSQVDPSLSWEITEEASAGLDFELLDRRLKGSFDVYDKTTTNVILNTKPYVTSGISNASPAHVGEYLIKDTKLVCVGTIKLLKT